MDEKQECFRIMEGIHKSLSNGIRSAKAYAPREWLKQRKLSAEITGACFNSGQIHHRKPEEYIRELESVGFLVKVQEISGRGNPGYATFQSNAVVFPLRDEKDKVVNFFGINIKNGKTRYMNDRGIYPAFPKEGTKKLYIVPGIMDAATLMESKVMDNREAVMALFDGKYKDQHREVLKAFAGKLDQIIFVKTKEREEQ